MTGWLVLTVTAAALAAALAVSSPAGARHRVRHPVASRADRWPARLAPLPSAPPMRRRIVLAVPAGTALSLAFGFLASAAPWTILGSAVALTGAGTVALGRMESAESRRAAATLLADLPQMWELMAACLAAGLPLRTALAEVVAVQDGQLAEILGQVLTRIRLGEPEDTAWRSLGDHPLLGAASRDLARSVASGTSVVELLGEYAVQARDDQAVAAESAAKAIGVRAVLPLMVCFLPAFFLIGIVPIIAGALLPLLSTW